MLKLSRKYLSVIFSEIAIVLTIIFLIASLIIQLYCLLIIAYMFYLILLYWCQIFEVGCDTEYTEMFVLNGAMYGYL